MAAVLGGFFHVYFHVHSLPSCQPPSVGRIFEAKVPHFVFDDLFYAAPPSLSAEPPSFPLASNFWHASAFEKAFFSTAGGPASTVPPLNVPGPCPPTQSPDFSWYRLLSWMLSSLGVSSLNYVRSFSFLLISLFVPPPPPSSLPLFNLPFLT